MGSKGAIFGLVMQVLLPWSSAMCSESAPESAEFNETLETLRAAAHLPALAAAVLRDGRIEVVGAVGVRRAGTPELVTVTDPFHIGSDTKAMTATLAAILVEEGRIGWNTTVGDLFPDERGLDPACRAITLEELLLHRSGLPHNLPARGPYRDLAWQEKTPGPEQRLFLLRDVLARPPERAIGETFHYSDVGYGIIGAMVEKATGQPWRILMRTRLFEPLGMRSAGFGYPGRLAPIVGHDLAKNGTFVPVEPGPGDDDPAALGPAGNVHCSIEDWAKFALLHLRGAREDTPLLKRAVFARLHTPPPGQEFAMGWLAVTRPWSGGIALSHAGSNGHFLALAWLAPQKDFGVLVLTNCVGSEAEKTCDRVVTSVLRQHHMIQPNQLH